jgi:hypothetical protein
VVTVYASAEAASTQGMSGPGTRIDVPPMGDQSAGFRQLERTSAETGDVLYTIKVRSGAVVASIEEEGAAASLTSPDEAVALARLAAARVMSRASGQ